jgi:pilus assembly protein CpaE
MTSDESVASAVESALKHNGHTLAGPAIRDVRDLPVHLARAGTSIVLVDLDPQPQALLPQLERVVARYPMTRFVALATSLDSSLLLEAMQSGVRRVVAKQTLGADLPGVLDRMTAADATQSGAHGQIVTVLSASGGCGATTIAVNLADELALEKKQPTLLCDLDCHYGAVAGYLGLHPRYAADHVLNYAGPIDGQLIRSTSTVHSDRLHVLASPASTNFCGGEPLKFDRLTAALESARQAYVHTVIDAPRLPIDVAASLVAASNCSLLVFQLTVKDLRTARSMLDALIQRGIDTTAIFPVANRFAKRQMIGVDEAAKALGGNIAITPVRNDYAAAIQGVNYGQTLSQAGPRSNLRKDLQDLIAKLRERKLQG